MLINLSNHPKNQWQQEQISEGEKLYGEIIDLDFPQIPPEEDENYIIDLVQYYYELCASKLKQSESNRNAVHLMGESNFCFSLTSKLLESGIECIASTTKRNTIIKNNIKTSEFKFVRFRKY